MDSVAWLEKGMVYVNGNAVRGLSSIPWTEHPKYSGVYIQSLFESSDSFSAMIVKMNPFAEIGNHIHEGKSELHEVIYGEGIAEIDHNEVTYHPGIISCIPCDTTHRVTAAQNGLILFAKFFSAHN